MTVSPWATKARVYRLEERVADLEDVLRAAGLLDGPAFPRVEARPRAHRAARGRIAGPAPRPEPPAWP